MCTILIKIWLRKPICRLLTLPINHRSLTKFSRPFVHFTKMHSIFLTSLLFQIFKEENQQLLFPCLDGKKGPPSSNIFSSAFLHFHMLDLLWKWGTCISFPSILFFIGSRKYWLVLLSAVSSQFSFDLLGRFPVLSLLHVLLVKTGSKVYCGHKRDPRPDEPDSACDEHHYVTKTCTTHNWYGSCITRTM